MVQHTHCQCDFCTGEDCEFTKIDPDVIYKDAQDKLLDRLQNWCKFLGSENMTRISLWELEEKIAEFRQGKKEVSGNDNEVLP